MAGVVLPPGVGQWSCHPFVELLTGFSVFAFSDRESIFFNSHNVSKPESSSVLTEVRPSGVGLALGCCCLSAVRAELSKGAGQEGGTLAPVPTVRGASQGPLSLLASGLHADDRHGHARSPLGYSRWEISQLLPQREAIPPIRRDSMTCFY